MSKLSSFNLNMKGDLHFVGNFDLSRKMNQVLVNRFRKASQEIVKEVKILLQTNIPSAIYSSPEYKSLMSDGLGELKSELGVPDGADKMAGIISSLVENIQVGYQITNIGGKLRGLMWFRALKGGNYDYLLALPEAQQMTDKGQALPWLKWLIIDGFSFQVRDYLLLFDPGNFPTSRTGLAIMVPTPYAKRYWSVPPQYAGTPQDNFIVRALKPVFQQIPSYIKKYFGVR